MIDGTVVSLYMEGSLIMKSEKLVFQSLQKPHCCDRGKRQKQLFTTESFLSVYFFA